MVLSNIRHNFGSVIADGENPHGHIYMPNTKVSATIWKSGNIQWIWKWISGAVLIAWKISLTNLPEYAISVPVFWYGNQLEFEIIIIILWKNMHAFTQLAIQTHILHFSLKMHTAKGAEESLNLFVYIWVLYSNDPMVQLQIPGTKCDRFYFKSNRLFTESVVHKSVTSFSETIQLSSEEIQKCAIGCSCSWH